MVARHIVIPDGFDASESISGANNFWVNSCVFTDSGVRVILTPDTYDLMLQAVDLQTCEQGSSSFNKLNKGGFLGVELPKIGAQEEMTKRLYDENATNIVSFAMKMYNKFIRTGTIPNIARAMAGEMQEQFEQAAPDQRVGFISLSASEITAKPISFIGAIFDKAEEYDLCVIFIDEVDAIATNRFKNYHYDHFIEKRTMSTASVSLWGEGSLRSSSTERTTSPWVRPRICGRPRPGREAWWRTWDFRTNSSSWRWRFKRTPTPTPSPTLSVQEASALLKRLYQETKGMLMGKRELIITLAKEVFERKTMTGEEFEECYQKVKG